MGAVAHFGPKVPQILIFFVKFYIGIVHNIIFFSSYQKYFDAKEI
jgi:hypothetical protein